MSDETLAQWLRRTDQKFIAGAVLPPRLKSPTPNDFDDLREQLRKPNLGLATTRELAEELRLRGDLAMVAMPTSERGADGAVLSALGGVILKSSATETLEAHRGE